MTISHSRTASPTSFDLTSGSSTGFAVDESLLERARSIGPTIAEHAEASERQRRLARPVVEAMRAAGLFRMFTPRALGGYEADPVTVARVAEEVSGFDSAAGWALQAGNTGAWWAGVYARSPLERHFRDAQTVRQHGFLCESRLETVGQVYLGVEPEFGFVAF